MILFMNSISYAAGVTNENPYNSRLTDKVETWGVEKQLSAMKSKTYPPSYQIRSSYTNSKEGLYDIDWCNFNDKYNINTINIE